MAAAELLATAARGLELPGSPVAETCRSARRRFGARLRAVKGCERSLYACTTARSSAQGYAPRPSPAASVLLSLAPSAGGIRVFEASRGPGNPSAGQRNALTLLF